ncbi:putative membrane protein [Arcanobacterium hippocoleae]|uniref:Membrane protein n=1 Tax=Arcanobacterium hippocoleae TaxID=149017 RepID=A0ABU1T3Z4_9ACTO|nr:putative membrane protein [Arcanobacterium hippocoleae]
MLCSSFAGFLIFLSGALLLITGFFNLITAAILAFALGIRTGLAGSVTNMMLRSFIPANLLPKAISVNQARDSVVQLGGEPLGGFLLELGKPIPYLTNCILNAAGFISALMLPSNTFAPAADGKNTVKKSVL